MLQSLRELRIERLFGIENTEKNLRLLRREPFLLADGNRHRFTRAVRGCSGRLPAGAFRDGLGGSLKVSASGSLNAA